MINNKSQALLISLWILVILTMLTVGIGYRVSLALRLSSYQKNKLKCIYLAKAAENIAINELEKDTNDYDGLDEKWANYEERFKRIVLDDGKDGFATISHISEEDGLSETIFGVVDEERKININIASKELLTALLESCGINPAQEIVNNILIWRGDIADTNSVYEGLGYPCKADKFNNIEELTLVKGITPESYLRLKSLVTIYGNGFININTASSEVLTIYAEAIAKQLSIGENFAVSISSKIINFRDTYGPFRNKNEISISATGDEETNVLNRFLDKITFKSNNFLIEVTGNTGKIESKIIAVYNRSRKRILYYYEA